MCFDHVAGFIINANHRNVRTAARFRVVALLIPFGSPYHDSDDCGGTTMLAGEAQAADQKRAAVEMAEYLRLKGTSLDSRFRLKYPNV